MKVLWICMLLVLCVGCAKQVDQRFDTIQHTLLTYERALQTRDTPLFMEALYFLGNASQLNPETGIAAQMNQLTPEQAAQFKVDYISEKVNARGDEANVTIKLWTYNTSGVSKLAMKRIKGEWKINAELFIDSVG